MPTFPKNSLGASTEKSENRMKIGGTIAIALWALCFIAFNTYQHTAFLKAGPVLQVLSIITFILSIGALWLFDRIFDPKSGSTKAFVAGGLLLLGSILAGGLSSHG